MGSLIDAGQLRKRWEKSCK